MNRTAKVILITSGALVLGVCALGGIGAAVSGGVHGQARASTPVAPGVQHAAPSTAASPAPPPVTVAAAPVVPSVGEGSWTVGEDLPAGIYKVTGAPKECYWAIYTSGQNQSFDALIDNHLGGGNLRVTLKAGQDFETKRCGTWVKQ